MPLDPDRLARHLTGVLHRFKTVDGVRIEEYRDGKSSHVYVDGHLYPGRYEHALNHYEKKEKQDAPSDES